MKLAKYDLKEKLKKLKYEYETKFDDEDYFFAKATEKNELENNPIRFEIMKKKINLNELVMR